MKLRKFLLMTGLLLFSTACNIPRSKGEVSPTTRFQPEINAKAVSTTVAANITPKHSATPTLPEYPTVTPSVQPTLPTNPTTSQGETPVGEPMVLLKTGQPLTITQITMIDLTSGWGIGQQSDDVDHVVRTADGGQTWKDVSPPQYFDPSIESRWVVQTAFLGSEHAWVIYAPLYGFPPQGTSVWRTMDGGKNWEASPTLPLNGMEGFFCPGFFAYSDKLHGWLLVHVDAGMNHDYSDIFATEDGGLSWQRITDPRSDDIDSLMSLPIVGLDFADEDWGWATKSTRGVMPGAFLVQTLDGGMTWENIFLPSPDDLNWEHEIFDCTTQSPAFPAESTGYLLVNCRDMNDHVSNYFYATDDKGKTWRYTLMSGDVSQLVFWDSARGFALGSDVLHTEDGGKTWVKIKKMKWEGRFSFVDEQNGWAVARDNGQVALVRTTDGGKTWDLLKPLVGE